MERELVKTLAKTFFPLEKKMGGEGAKLLSVFGTPCQYKMTLVPRTRLN